VSLDCRGWACEAFAVAVVGVLEAEGEAEVL